MLDPANNMVKHVKTWQQCDKSYQQHGKKKPNHACMIKHVKKWLAT